jgi:hypothetical protein
VFEFGEGVVVERLASEWTPLTETTPGIMIALPVYKGGMPSLFLSFFISMFY